MQSQIIHIEWEGPFHLCDLDAGALDDSSRDYGLYQVYGAHTVYGSDVLLYIGKADRQTFNTRLKQEKWDLNKDAKSLSIFVGRVAGYQVPTNQSWSDEITLAEKLLIFAHAPARNSQNIQDIPGLELKNIHVLNWGCFRSLLPEVSGARWTLRYFDDFQEELYNVYTMDTST